jgi:hypothetical protein
MVLATISTHSRKKTTSSNYTMVEAWEKSGKNYYMYLEHARKQLCDKRERK